MEIFFVYFGSVIHQVGHAFLFDSRYKVYSSIRNSTIAYMWPHRAGFIYILGLLSPEAFSSLVHGLLFLWSTIAFSQSVIADRIITNITYSCNKCFALTFSSLKTLKHMILSLKECKTIYILLKQYLIYR